MAEYTEEQIEAIVARKVAEQTQVQNPLSVDSLVTQQFGPARITRDNNILDQMKVARMSKDEREKHNIHKEVATEATLEIAEIDEAKRAVKRAKFRGKNVTDDVLALANKELSKVHVECLVEQTHVGDGTKLHKGEKAHIHEDFARILEDAGHVRIIRPGRPKKKDNEESPVAQPD